MSLSTSDDSRAAKGRVQFLRWKLGGLGSFSNHALSSEGQTTVNFLLRVNEHLHSIHPGVILYNQSRHPLWSPTTEGVTLEAGLYEIRYTIASPAVVARIFVACRAV
jgi:hypothetical protein